MSVSEIKNHSERFLASVMLEREIDYTKMKVEWELKKVDGSSMLGISK